MITVTEHSEFGDYQVKYNHGYRVNSIYNCIDDYKEVDNPEEWLNCPCCGLKPKTWVFNNGASTSCGCWNDRYHHFSVCSESILSVYNRCQGNVSQYNRDNLRKNWNEYCLTMINPCNSEDLRFESKW